MEYLRIHGGRRLGGHLTVHGAKNSVLPILAASVLIKGEIVLHNCPQLSDVAHTVEILRYLGVRVKQENETLILQADGLQKSDVPEKWMQEMRSSIIFLGALAAANGEATMSMPGGCTIGLRPIDMHISGLRALGYHCTFDGSHVRCRRDNARAGRVVLPFPSVGATENMVLASVLLSGKTTIINAAREPEIADLCHFLNAAGACIRGIDTAVLEIEGVASLHSVQHTVMPDRILAATAMCAAAATHSELRIHPVCLTDLEPIFPVFDEAGCRLFLETNSLFIQSPKRLRRVKSIETYPYPGFPTDCQAPVMAMLCTARGSSLIHETIFENRFQHVPLLKRFGADIEVKERVAVIRGVSMLHAAQASATDLRGGAALVIAALAAQGISEIYKPAHIDRGYAHIEQLFAACGASIERITHEREKDEEKESTAQAIVADA